MLHGLKASGVPRLAPMQALVGAQSCSILTPGSMPGGRVQRSLVSKHANKPYKLYKNPVYPPY